MTKKMLMVSAASALLLVGGGAATGFWMTRDGVTAQLDKDAVAAGKDAENAVADADSDAGKLVRQDQPIYYSFDPPFVVNAKGSGAMIQVGLAVGTHYASTNDALKNDDPALRSAVLMTLADVTEDMADDDAGKVQLQGRLTAAVNRQLVADGYSGNVDSVFFTSFIVQGGEG